jgi:hypothetical protein
VNYSGDTTSGIPHFTERFFGAICIDDLNGNLTEESGLNL